jgi:hypothetical protein
MLEGDEKVLFCFSALTDFSLGNVTQWQLPIPSMFMTHGQQLLIVSKQMHHGWQSMALPKYALPFKFSCPEQSKAVQNWLEGLMVHLWWQNRTCCFLRSDRHAYQGTGTAVVQKASWLEICSRSTSATATMTQGPNEGL